MLSLPQKSLHKSQVRNKAIIMIPKKKKKKKKKKTC